MHANFCDPGFEYKEDLVSGANAAAAGGFTAVSVLPNTNPIVQSKSLIEYVINKTQSHLVDVFPQGALSEQMNKNGLKRATGNCRRNGGSKRNKGSRIYQLTLAFYASFNQSSGGTS